MSPRSSVALIFAIATGCGGVSQPPSASTPARPAPSALEAEPQAPRESSLASRWPFAQPPVAAVHADLEGLLRTDLARGLVSMALGTFDLDETQVGCVRQLVAGAKELAAGYENGNDVVLLLRVDPAAMPTPDRCLESIPGIQPKRVPGADRGYELRRLTVAVHGDIVVAGSEQRVAAALKGGTHGTALPTLHADSDHYLQWSVTPPGKSLVVTGGMRASSERFRIDVALAFDNTEEAERIEQLVGRARVDAGERSHLDAQQAKAVQRFADAVTFERSGNRLALAFELREKPVEQARALGLAAALMIAGVRRYILDAKLVEVKTTLRAIAESYQSSWHAGDRALFALPAVPTDVQHATKYMSAPADWQAWERIHFSIQVPQRFQYLVRVAKNGRSGEVLAHGDLDGDGKASTYAIDIKLDPRTGRVVVGKTIRETDPDE